MINAASVTAHYCIRRQHPFWLLERKDTGQGLALFDTQRKAIERAERLAFAMMPSQLEIQHETKHVEQRNYPFVATHVARNNALLRGLYE